MGSGFEAFILIDEGINKDQLLARFKKDSEKAQAEAKKTEAKLGGSFAQHAPQELVQAERDKLDELKRRIEKLTSYIVELQ